MYLAYLTYLLIWRVFVCWFIYSLQIYRFSLLDLPHPVLEAQQVNQELLPALSAIILFQASHYSFLFNRKQLVLFRSPLIR